MPRFPPGTGMTDAQRLENLTSSSCDTVSDTVRVKNRRKRYLDTHPDYFSASLELAGLRHDV